MSVNQEELKELQGEIESLKERIKLSGNNDLDDVLRLGLEFIMVYLRVNLRAFVEEVTDLLTGKLIFWNE